MVTKYRVPGDFNSFSFLNFSAKVECPEGWGEHFSGYCYLPVASESTYSVAQAYCKDNNTEANLVSVLSDYENDFVREMAASLGNLVWIGYSDRFSEGNWAWEDGSVGVFTQWNEGTSQSDFFCGVILILIYTKNCNFMFKFDMEIEKTCVIADRVGVKS